MSFAQLQAALLRQANQEIHRVRAKYQREYAAKEEEITERARDIEESVISAAEQEADQEVKQRHQHVQLSARADVLRVKQAELDRLQTATVQEILAWPEAETRRFLTALLTLITERQGTITAGAAHAALVRELAAARGLTVHERVMPEEGGFVFHGERTELNATVRHLVREVFRQRRAELAGILFGS